jgi:hypothetical protein
VVDDDEIRTLVSRLARSHASGGQAIARAAIMAEGADATEVIAWILAHDGQPEAGAASGPASGLHQRRTTGDAAAASRPPVRYIVPAAAFVPPDPA